MPGVMASDALTRAARLRVPLGFVSAAIVLWLAHPTPRTLTAGTAIACLGEALRIWAAGHINKSREVTTSGPYRWFAHPLYVGSSVMGTGLAIAANSLLVGLFVAAYLVATITVAIKAEEAFLRRRFGDEYDRYRLGGVRPAAAEADNRREFQLGQAIRNREYRAVIGLVLVVAVLLWKSI
jgi:hypothetical protein